MSLKLSPTEMFSRIAGGIATQEDIDAYKAFTIAQYMTSDGNDIVDFEVRTEWLKRMFGLYRYADKGLKP